MISALLFLFYFFRTNAHPLSPKLVRKCVWGRGGYVQSEGGLDSAKMIPLRVVALQCVMYNTCTGVCNKQQDGIVGSPHRAPLVISTKKHLPYNVTYSTQFLRCCNSCCYSKMMFSLSSVCTSVSLNRDEQKSMNI